jgi:hypothetical protein
MFLLTKSIYIIFMYSQGSTCFVLLFVHSRYGLAVVGQQRLASQRTSTARARHCESDWRGPQGASEGVSALVDLYFHL